MQIAGFHCHAAKLYLLSKKNPEYYRGKKLLDILLVQVPGLYGIPYSSYPSKCSTQIYRAQYENAMLVPMPMGTNIVVGNQ